MSTEQRLVDALEATRSFQPSPDLWGRLVHSIEEDRSHRRRVLTSALAVAVTVLAAVAMAVPAVSTFEVGSRVDWRMIEAIETAILVVLIVSLGPAIRRFGRGYVRDLIPGEPAMAASLLRLLDVAYYLVFAGYLLVTAHLSAPDAFRLRRLGSQVEEAAARVGGLLATMGLLHALSFMALPLIALVINANRKGARLPRWVTFVIGLAAVAIAGLLAIVLPPLLQSALG